MATTVNLIAAIDLNRAIGLDGDQLAYIGQDLRHFKALTLGKPVVMGRRTNEALPRRRLPGRRNIVLTRDASFAVEGVEVAASPSEALGMVDGEAEVFVIGGAQIYEAFLPMASRIFLTVIEHRFERADTFFPDFSSWAVAERSAAYADEKSGLSFHFETLTRGRGAEGDTQIV